MHLHDFGLVASKGDIPHYRAFQAFRDCLQTVSVASKHPELVPGRRVGGTERT